jgi:hypothetical protein
MSKQRLSNLVLCGVIREGINGKIVDKFNNFELEKALVIIQERHSLWSSVEVRLHQFRAKVMKQAEDFQKAKLAEMAAFEKSIKNPDK